MASLLVVRNLKHVLCRECNANCSSKVLKQLFNNNFMLRSACSQSKYFSVCSIKVLNFNPKYKQAHHATTTAYYTTSAHESNRDFYVPDKSTIDGYIKLKNEQGLCLIAVPLYSREEVCRIVLKPLMNTLNDLMNNIRIEDAGVQKIRAFTLEGDLISNNTSIADLLKNDFILQMNELNYMVQLNGLDFSSPYIEGDSVKNLVAQLYMAINSDEVFIKRQEKLMERLEGLQLELLPMEKVVSDMKDLAARKTRIMSWVGLSMMGLQFGILARLTWWEYSWDIMEPVTYFVTYGTIMAMFSYYIITNQEYIYPDVHDRQVVRLLHKISKKGEFDLVRYNYLCDEVSKIKYDLRRLRDPIKLQLHPPHIGANVTSLPSL
ncbi:hypothetical protein HELRODRAFT_108883 [Helobdella robusta]|uniref:Calcium uniporter protein n=1 Tax=Helobdella robusta TaxID=6412 RepID=T1EEN4_HELRO|nr:hypothetical protein HELRODRAFT_108883 [Helobdella robusta]ESO11611.1 hypothetical protein HELRODRAFT_108883 [Helobdella robusta]